MHMMSTHVHTRTHKEKNTIFITHLWLWICIVIFQNLKKLILIFSPRKMDTSCFCKNTNRWKFSVKYISPIEQHLIHTHTHTHLAPCISPQAVPFANHQCNSVWCVEVMDSDKVCKPVIKGRIDYSLHAGHYSAYISHSYNLWNIRGKQEDRNKVERGLTASLTNEWHELGHQSTLSTTYI